MGSEMCIRDSISTAQHARPKVMGHAELWRAQLTILSSVDRVYSGVSVVLQRSTHQPHCAASRG